ncbi:MAG: diacylglycerol kinase family protein [Flavobacteriales bacterium]
MNYLRACSLSVQWIMRFLHFVQKQLKSFQHAFKGMLLLFREEPNARIHLVAMLGAFLLGGILGIKAWEWTAIVLASGLVLGAEALNTALEKMADLLVPGSDERIRRIKDLGAGTVLIAAIAASVIALLIFLPYFL